MKTIKNLKADEIRKSILQLAIQGKLVKQDPNDEPASELVKRIYAEKQKLIKEGKIKKEKNESYIFKGDDNCYYEKIDNNDPVKLENLPFDIPDNWSWCNAKAVLNIVVGATPSTANHNFWDGDISWLPSGCCQDCDVTEDYPKRKYITKAGYESCSTTMMKPNTVLIALTGATAGKIGLLKFDACANQSVVGMSQYYGINPQFLFFQFMARRKEILADCIGSAQPHISKNYIEKMYIAIPPLEEQQRIVDKINSFEPLLKDYELAEEKLSKLEEEFPEKLKKSILQYAIEGKLVKQDPNDEPASVLLERIKHEKEKLIKEGKIKRDKNESYIYQGDDKNYYKNLPQGWISVRRKSIILKYFGGGTPSKDISTYWKPEISWCSVKDLGDKLYIDSTIDMISAKGLENSSSNIVPKGEIILCSRMAVGKIRIPLIDMAINQDLKCIIVSKNILKEYYIISSITSELKSTGTTVKGLDFNNYLNHFILLPPLKEQHRIVSKLDYLFSQING